MSERRLGDHEAERLDELMKAFPTERHYSIFEAIHYLKSSFIYLNNITLNGDKAWLKDKTHLLNKIKLLHRLLFFDMLSNAGEFRNSNDALQGKVYFGGTDSRSGRPKFEGVLPSQIEGDILKVTDFILNSQIEPRIKAVRFYAQFVRIHPFHDGNGRVGRIILNAMLSESQLFIDWDRLHKSENQFLNKLNRYHKTQLEDDLLRLTSFFNKFIITVNEEG